MNKIVIAIVVIVILLGGAFVGYKLIHHFTKAPVAMTQTMKMSPTPTGMMMATASGTMMEATGSAMNGGVEDIAVTGTNFSFSPSTITVKKGTQVKITFTASGGSHDFVIDEFNVKTPIVSSGQSATVEFTASKIGTFDYYCSVDHHRAMGMQGTLTVE